MRIKDGRASGFSIIDDRGNGLIVLGRLNGLSGYILRGG